MKSQTASFPPEFKIDPMLESAIQRWFDTTQQAFEEINTTQNGINPVQSFLQSSARTTDFLSKLDWLGIIQKPQKVEEYQQIVQEFSDFLTAATQRVSEGQSELLENLVKDAGEIINTPPSLTNPQAALAAWINKGLDSYSSTKENLGNQLQTAISIQSAFLAWYQQSLISISDRQQK
jgi:hypothetical protein